MYVGWDWADKTHDVTVVGEEGRIVDHFEVGHHEAGFKPAWLRVIWSCWHSDIPYDPALHRSELHLARA